MDLRCARWPQRAQRNVRGWVPFAAILALATMASCPALAEPPGTRRPLQVQDLFEMEGIGHGYGGSFAFSPDGRSLAFTRLRPRKTLTNHQLEFLVGNERGDVWLQAQPGSPAVNLTNGLATASGWWAPQWSPDGRWLAMLSVHDGRVMLWGWEKPVGQLEPLSNLEVDLRDYEQPPFLWVGARKILLPVFVDGAPRDVIESDLEAAPRAASTAWRDAVKGEIATASALNSGVTAADSPRPKGRLLLVDVDSGESRTILDESTSAWTLSPRGDAIAFARQTGVYVPRADEVLPLNRISPTPALGVYTVEIQSLDGKSLVPARVPQDVRVDSLRWSPNGRELAFIAFGESRRELAKLFRIDIGTHRMRSMNLGSLDSAPGSRLRVGLEWTSSGEIMLFAAQRAGSGHIPATARRDWWLLRADGRLRCLTAKIAHPPRELWADTKRRAFFGVAGGVLWRLEPSSGSLTEAAASPSGSVEGIEWPLTLSWDDSAEYHSAGDTYEDIVFSVRHESTLAHYRLATHSGKVMPLELPDPSARLAAYASRTESAVFTSTSGNGTFVWRNAPDSRSTETLMEANTFLRNVAGGELRSISYTSLEGEALTGWLILPYGYEPKKRYPLLTWVHGGFIAGPEPPYWHTVSYADALNMHIPAARGYAVLLPSMPVRTPGDADEVMLGLSNGALPAVQKAIDLGVADAERLFVGGHSFGGYATYGLVAQTNRFKAAVSLAGASNLVSQYGAFDPRLRYGHHPHENLTNVTRMEVGQTNLGSTPWEDLGRYLRNSPISYVGNMQTPLLIVQGDLDFVPLQQGEELFMSLYRQGKRAQFVRYWGEGHELRSPANVQDMWSRVFAWLDEFGDIARDPDGRILFDGEKVRSRRDASAGQTRRAK